MSSRCSASSSACCRLRAHPDSSRATAECHECRPFIACLPRDQPLLQRRDRGCVAPSHRATISLDQRRSFRWTQRRELSVQPLIVFAVESMPPAAQRVGDRRRAAPRATRGTRRRESAHSRAAPASSSSSAINSSCVASRLCATRARGAPSSPPAAARTACGSARPATSAMSGRDHDEQALVAQRQVEPPARERRGRRACSCRTDPSRSCTAASSCSGRNGFCISAHPL